MKKERFAPGEARTKRFLTVTDTPFYAGTTERTLGGSSETRNACIHAALRTLLPVVYPNFSHFLPQPGYPAWDRDHPSGPSGYAHQPQAPAVMLRC